MYAAMSCSNANLYVYSALLGVHDRMMSLDVASGGHLSHGYTRGRKKISHISKYFETLPYHLDASTGTIDYDGLEALAAHYKPKLIVAGTSTYSRLIDYARIRAIASRSPAFVMSDISHISGLIAAGLIPSPFEHSDVVTSSTAKLLRGPRGGIIFYRKGVPLSLAKRNGNGNGNGTTVEDAINSSVFPGHQSSPHNNTTAALAVALQQALTPQFKEYQRLVLLNARALADALKELGYALASGGTDTHLVLLDLRSKGIDGARVERVLEVLGVASNRNVLAGDVSVREPSGLRIGSPVMTARGLKPEDFAQIARFVHRAVELTKELMVLADNGGSRRGARESNGNGNGLERFMNFVAENENLDMVAELRSEIRAWVERFTATS
jgi:glycine hydroxymethyltransferase